jgi:hypothetical protein
MRTLPLPASLLAALAAASASAHHSWSAEYDVSRSTSMSGTVARVLFRNPHSALVVDVATENGRQERWTVEWASPQRLRDRGITEGTVRVGETLLITGNPHRDDKVRSVRALSLHRQDGTEVGGSAPEGEPGSRPGVPSASRR